MSRTGVLYYDDVVIQHAICLPVAQADFNILVVVEYTIRDDGKRTREKEKTKKRTDDAVKLQQVFWSKQLFHDIYIKNNI